MAKAGFNNSVMFADNVDFTGGLPQARVTADGQLLIGSTAAPNIRVGTLTSTGGTITITPGAGTINLDVAGGGSPIEKIGVQTFVGPGTNPVVPAANQITINGVAAAQGTVPIQSISRAANTLNIEVQRASTTAATDATHQGIASFNSAQFSASTDGFISLLNGVPASSFVVQAATAPGVTPVVPSAGGAVTISGTIVAAHSIPIRTNSLAVNAYNIETQYASAQAADTPAASGMCHFNSAQFTVSPTGFVSAISGTAPWLDSAGGAMANHTGYFATAAAAFTLPAGVANGDQVEIVDTVGGGVVVTAQGGNKIQIQNTASSVNGTATSSQKGDSLRLTFRLADGIWYQTPGAGGNWLLA